MSKLSELRKENKFSNQYMADQLNISKPFYWQLEHEQRKLSYDMAFKISKIFGLKPDDLFYDEYNKKTIQ
ncbi:MAG: helix-turn-helix transcriptional regulator [Firmicutes bacterium]|nr:helix-turn-helix transcriptional regulator [Bacillota bacterium]